MLNLSSYGTYKVEVLSQPWANLGPILYQVNIKEEKKKKMTDEFSVIYIQSPYINVLWLSLFMKQKLRFGLVGPGW